MSAPDCGQVRLTQADGVATIELVNPPGNRITVAMRRELLAAIQAVGRGDAHVLTFRGDGSDFCCGGDVREWVGIPAETLRPKIEVFADALRALGDLDIPTIAVVQGACMGGGCELALGCDFIVATETAIFRFPEAKSGILTLQGGALTLADRIGDTRALRAVLLTETLTAAALHRDGVVSDVVVDSAIDTAMATLIDRLAAAPATVVAATKQLFRLARTEQTPAAITRWYDVSMPLFDQRATQAALLATARVLDAA